MALPKRLANRPDEAWLIFIAAKNHQWGDDRVASIPLIAMTRGLPS